MKKSQKIERAVNELRISISLLQDIVEECKEGPASEETQCKVGEVEICSIVSAVDGIPQYLGDMSKKVREISRRLRAMFLENTEERLVRESLSDSGITRKRGFEK